MSDLGDPAAAAARFNANADAAAGPILEAARAMGQQRHADSPQGQRLAADIARITSTYRPDFGPGAAMAGRENALAAVAQPPGPSWADRAASSREGMLGMVGQALANQGGLPTGNLREDVASLAPGTTLRGTSELGTPMVASRGNAQPVDAETRQAQANYLANRRGERGGRLREAVMGNAMRQAYGQMQQQQAIAQQQQGQMFQNLFARDPQAATQLMAAMGQQQIGMGQTQILGQQVAGNHQIAQQRLLAEAANARDNVGLRRREMRQQLELGRQELAQRQAVTDAEAQERLANAGLTRGQANMLDQRGGQAADLETLNTLQGMDSTQMSPAARRMAQSATEAVLNRIHQMSAGGGLSPLQQAVSVPLSDPRTAEDAQFAMAQQTPALTAMFGEGFGEIPPAELMQEVHRRTQSGAPVSEADMKAFSEFLQNARSAVPDYAPKAAGSIRELFRDLFGSQASAYESEARAAAEGRHVSPSTIAEAVLLNQLRQDTRAANVKETARDLMPWNRPGHMPFGMF